MKLVHLAAKVLALAFSPFTAGVALAGLVGGSMVPAKAVPAQVILVRHADKDRRRGDYNLSPAGLERAMRLSKTIPACFGAPDRIFTYEFDLDTMKNARSYQSAVPLAVATGINIDIVQSSMKHSEAYGADVLGNRQFDGKKLVFFWEHRRLPKLAEGLGYDMMPPIENNQFDLLVLLTYPEGSQKPLVKVFSQDGLASSGCIQ
jgi:hypothetical protein